MTTEPASERTTISLSTYAILLIVPLVITLVGNFVGPDIPILQALPGAFILYLITMLGLIIAKYVPFNLPEIAWVVLAGILITMPWTPGSEWLAGQTDNVDFVAMATPILAYAGLALLREHIDTFAKSGWKLILLAMFIFSGTFLGSALIAQVVLKIQGII